MTAPDVKPKMVLEAVRIRLFDLAGGWVVDGTVVVNEACNIGMPAIVMFNGDPYLRDAEAYERERTHIYREERPFRLDAGA